MPIALYSFQLWFFKSAFTIRNISELKKIWQRTALWITEAFCTLLLEGIEAIAGLIPITLYLQKLNRYHYLQYISILPSYVINSILDIQHAKNYPP